MKTQPQVNNDTTNIKNTTHNTRIVLGVNDDGSLFTWDSKPSPTAFFAMPAGVRRDKMIQRVSSYNKNLNPLTITLNQDITQDELKTLFHDVGSIIDNENRLVILDIDVPDWKLLDDRFMLSEYQETVDDETKDTNTPVLPTEVWSIITSTLRKYVEYGQIALLVVTTDCNDVLTPNWMFRYAQVRLSSGRISKGIQFVTFATVNDINQINDKYDSRLADECEDSLTIGKNDTGINVGVITVQAVVNKQWVSPFMIPETIAGVNDRTGTGLIPKIAKASVITILLTGLLIGLGVSLNRKDGFK